MDFLCCRLQLLFSGIRSDLLLIQMKNGMQGKNPFHPLWIQQCDSRTRSKKYGKLRMLLQIRKDIRSGLFFNLQTANVYAVDFRSIQSIKPFLLKSILSPMITGKSSLSVIFHKTVTAAVFCLRLRHRRNDSSLCQCISYKISIRPGSHWEKRNIRNFKMPDRIRRIIGTASQ